MAPNLNRCSPPSATQLHCAAPSPSARSAPVGRARGYGVKWARDQNISVCRWCPTATTIFSLFHPGRYTSSTALAVDRECQSRDPGTNCKRRDLSALGPGSQASRPIACSDRAQLASGMTGMVQTEPNSLSPDPDSVWPRFLKFLTGAVELFNPTSQRRATSAHFVYPDTPYTFPRTRRHRPFRSANHSALLS